MRLRRWGEIAFVGGAIIVFFFFFFLKLGCISVDTRR